MYYRTNVHELYIAEFIDVESDAFGMSLGGKLKNC